MKLFNIIDFFPTDYNIVVQVEPNIYTNETERINYAGFDHYLIRHKRLQFSTITKQVDGEEMELTEVKSLNYYLSNMDKKEITADLYDYMLIHHADYSKALDFTLNNINELLKDYKQ
jgi:hypothetical protein